MKKIIDSFISIVAFAAFTLAYAQSNSITNDRQALLFPSVYVASDSENFSTYKYKAGYIPLFEHGEKYTGVTYQHNYFTQGNWNSSAEQYTVLTKSINPRSGLGYNLNASYNIQNGYRLLVTDSSYSFRATDTTTVEALINRDRVETQAALTSGVYYTLGGLSIEQKIIERLSAIVMGANMYFSDGNTRPTVRARLIYDVLPEYGLTAQLRYRQYRDTNTNVPNTYFNPSEYNETMLAFGARKRVSGWQLVGTAGVGRQTINQDPSTTTQLYELSATSPVQANDYYLRLRGGYGKSAGFLGPNYFYRYALAELMLPF
jgi:hypothetical protein